MCVLSVQNVTFSYKTKYQKVHALKGVSCMLQSETFYVLVGKNGSGKTTLLSLMAGLVEPEGGAVYFKGKNLMEIDKDIYRRKQVSVIYQNYNLFPLMTVLENIMYPLMLNGYTKKKAEEWAVLMMEKVGLNDAHIKRFPAMLSGGEQQRVAIARALATQPKVILADEPTGNLDAENTQQIIDLLYKLAHEEGCCVVVSTHDAEIKKKADVVWRMDNGRMEEDIL